MLGSVWSFVQNSAANTPNRSFHSMPLRDQLGSKRLSPTAAHGQGIGILPAHDNSDRKTDVCNELYLHRLCIILIGTFVGARQALTTSLFIQSRLYPVFILLPCLILKPRASFPSAATAGTPESPVREKRRADPFL